MNYFHAKRFVVCYFYSDKISNNVEEKVLQIGLIRMVGANVYFFGSEICFLCINLDKYKNCKDQHNLCSFRIV